MRKWEYAVLHLARDPAQEGLPVHGWFALPGDDDWRSLGEMKNTLEFLNQLGSEGWEMVGGPTVQSAVFTYKAASDVWHDRGSWIEKDYAFKREVEK